VDGSRLILPATHTPEMVRQLASFAPDAFCLHDAPDCAIDLPRFAYPDAAPGEPAADAPFAVPQIDAARIMAYVFTSRAATLIGTVPAQHMYGFESTVLLALIGGLAFSNRQPFYPSDIRDELDALPQP
ncbi:beta-hydroxyacyl-ACP dehydratase, partial [Burkholderia cenocepacia]|nr:beta-hydroxyacyl-ACP dehydratase [Burkholderia cenocepacia]